MVNLTKMINKLVKLFHFGYVNQLYLFFAKIGWINQNQMERAKDVFSLLRARFTSIISVRGYSYNTLSSDGGKPKYNVMFIT